MSRVRANKLVNRAGTDYTGSGGGRSTPSTPGNGGSGIVIIRYLA